MRTDSFDYELPEGQIATRPPADRDGGRMCVVGRAQNEHSFVRTWPERIDPGDLVVLNETRVRQARLICRRPVRLGRGGEEAGAAQVELLFLHPLGEGPVGQRHWAVLGRANRPLRPGDELHAAELTLRVLDKGTDGTLVVASEGDVEAALARDGQMPIPPYLKRPADADDVTRYQTVFARELGSAAAPTAGLHLTESAFERLRARGAAVGRLTLHVGIGTFRPVQVDDLDQHPMHEEEIEVSEALAAQIRETRQRGGRVVAVGTTVVRALESAAAQGEPGQVVPTRRRTSILIQPGHRFAVIDSLLTNFHQPKSTLLALVSAFAGHERIMKTYREAVERGYRFLSYGDAMWLPEKLT